MLLGLLREDKKLRSRLSKFEEVRKEIEARTPIREQVADPDEIPFSEGSERVLKNASNESEHLSHPHVGMEDILIGIVP